MEKHLLQREHCICTVCMIREFAVSWGGAVEHAKQYLSSISIMKKV